MKKLAILLCAIAPFVTAPLFAAEGSMTAEERAYLLDQLETSKKNMLASIQDLTAGQWTFKPAPAVWSVQECAEHIILAEDYIFSGSQQVLKTPVVPRPDGSNAEADHKLVAGVQDRSRKATAPEQLVPGRKFATPDDAVREFTARRDKTIAYVKTSNDDLRVHVGPGPAGPMDGYQILLLLASHSARHTAQIREVEANAGFPKKATSGL
ncbi:MAG: DinB family protein [Acidobacteriia bacterium]|nr:DinB family protein [Terriglobia bacterium]